MDRFRMRQPHIRDRDSFSLRNVPSTITQFLKKERVAVRPFGHQRYCIVLNGRILLLNRLVNRVADIFRT